MDVTGAMNRCGRVPWILRSDSSSGKWQVKGKKPTVEEEARNPRAGAKSR
jgi:hypothetical protein